MCSKYNRKLGSYERRKKGDAIGALKKSGVSNHDPTLHMKQMILGYTKDAYETYIEKEIEYANFILDVRSRIQNNRA